jgi:hypothetical protein
VVLANQLNEVNMTIGQILLVLWVAVGAMMVFNHYSKKK